MPPNRPRPPKRVNPTHRGTNAARHTRHKYAWHNTAGHIAALYQRHANDRTSRHHS
jgi:hypothetical protein